MRERTLILGTTMGGIVVSFLVLWALDFSIWPFGDNKVNCCINKMLPNAQCEKVSRKQCERVCGQEVEKCEDCFRQGSQGVVGGAGCNGGRPMAPP